MSKQKSIARKPLGRGLGNLLDTSLEVIEQKTKIGIVEIPLDKIRTTDLNPRKKFDSTSITELADTIKEHGLLQPILVMPKNSHYVVISGERRLRAMRQLSIEKAPCIIKNLDPKTTLEVALIENIQREQLDPIEEAKVYRTLINTHKLTQEELSSRVGKNRTTIANRIRLLSLPDTIQVAVADGRLSEGQVRPLIGIKNQLRQLKLLREIEKNGYNVRQIEDLVRKNKVSDKDKKQKHSDNSSIKDLKKKLEEHFSTRVSIQQNISKKNGKISFDFFSVDDLERLLDLMGYKNNLPS